ncbi:hypothetical protein [Streptomyces sp. NPDC005336]|uniref:hypothetical protein n=1 Tax=Streptomyces sp. NPDC005336 TaxID=3157035 RepID=UPI0033AD2D6D
MSVEDYVTERARRLNVSSPRPDTKSAFWSFEVPHPELPAGEGLSNMYIAEAWAESENAKAPDSARYLEGTRGGRALGNLRLWDKSVHQALDFTPEHGQDVARTAWSTLSQRYAEASTGEVAVFAPSAYPSSVLYNNELPALRTNPDVGLDHIKFVYEPPREWPETARNELGEDPVRAQAQFAWDDAPRHIDADTYAAKPPAERQATLDQLSADVVAADKNHERITPLTATATATAVSAGPAGPTAPTPVWQMGFAPKRTAAAKGTSSAPTGPPATATPGLGKGAAGVEVS